MLKPRKNIKLESLQSDTKKNVIENLKNLLRDLSRGSQWKLKLKALKFLWDRQIIDERELRKTIHNNTVGFQNNVSVDLIASCKYLDTVDWDIYEIKDFNYVLSPIEKFDFGRYAKQMIESAIELGIYREFKGGYHNREVMLEWDNETPYWWLYSDSPDFNFKK